MVYSTRPWPAATQPSLYVQEIERTEPWVVEGAGHQNQPPGCATVERMVYDLGVRAYGGDAPASASSPNDDAHETLFAHDGQPNPGKRGTTRGEHQSIGDVGVMECQIGSIPRVKDQR